MYMSKKGYLFDKRFLFDTREEAEAVLKGLRAIVDMHEKAFVMDLYDLSGYCYDVYNHEEDVEGNYAYYWTDLRRAFVTYTSDGYRLCLPTPKKPEAIAV